MMRFAAYFLVSIFLVKLKISAQSIGSYEYVLFLCSIVTGWWMDGLIQAYLSEAGQKPKEKGIFRKYSILLILITAGVILIFSLSAALLVQQKILEPLPNGFFFFLGFHLFLHAGILLAYHFFQKGVSRRIYGIGIYVFCLYAGSFLWGLSGGRSLPDVYGWLMAGGLPLLVVWLVYILRDRAGSRSADFLPGLAGGVLSLIIIRSIGFLSAWSDGFWVQYFYGAEEVFAVFRYGGRELPLFVILTSTFSTAMISMSTSPAGLKRIREGSRRFMKGFAGLVILLLITSQWLFTFVYSEEFVTASVIFDMYLLLILFRVYFGRSYLIGAQAYGGLMYIAAGELAVNIAMSYLLYQVMGLAGLVAGTLIAHMAEFVWYVMLIKKRYSLRFRDFISVRFYLWFVVIIIGVFLAKYIIFSSGWKLLLSM